MANRIVRIALRTILELAGAIAVGCITLGPAAMLFLLLLWPGLIALIAIGIAARLNKLPKRATLTASSFLWLVLITPVFGIGPFIIITRPLFYTLVPHEIIIYEGISLSGAYSLFFSFPDMNEVDHPFPPISDQQYWIMIAVTMGVAVVAMHFLYKVYSEKRKHA